MNGSGQISERMRIRSVSLSANTLKVMAVLAMTFDHYVAVFLYHNTPAAMALRLPGRIAAPIMCYLIAEGYHHTSNVKRYIGRLLLFALISHVPYNLAFGYRFFQATSVMWPLALGLIALAAVDDPRLPVAAKPFVLGLCAVLAIPADWHYVAVLWIVNFGLYRGDFKKQMIGFAVIGIALHLIPTYLNAHNGMVHWFQLGIFLAVPLLSLYNGERGRKSAALTWFFYVFYPLHLLLLYWLKR